MDLFHLYSKQTLYFYFLIQMVYIEDQIFSTGFHLQGGDSDNNGSDNSGSYESPEDELGYLLHKRGARKGSDERDPDYIPMEEVW
jgi:hypothetical protein